MFHPIFKHTFFFSFFLAASSHAATLNIGGNFRFGTNLYSNLDLANGDNANGGNTSTYIEYRGLLRPDVIIDDRFSVKSELSYFGLEQLSSSVEVPENFGTVLGQGSDPSGTIYLRRSWLEWASDWGILRVGRQPKDWGLGVKYHSGKDVLDDFGTTVDRVGFQALLGNLGVNFGYEKGNEGQLNSDSDDVDTYELALDYSNPESNLDVGIMYTRNVRGASSGSSLRSSHDLSIFSQKKLGKFQLGGEFVSVNQDAYGSASGLLAQVDYQQGFIKLGADFAWSAASSSAAYEFNPNYQPFLILFRQTLGTSRDADETRGGTTGAGVGAAIANGDGAGAVLIKGKIEYGIDQDKLVLGLNTGWAKLTSQRSNLGSTLGTEFDFFVTQKFYSNFNLHYAMGFLVPGDAFGPDERMAWGAQIRGALTF